MAGPGPGSGAAADRLRDPPLEIIVRNPSGGRGVYILPWTEIAALCRPTMHDMVLGQAIGAAGGEAGRALTPGFVRQAARQVAALGLAGRVAARTAQEAEQARTARLQATRYTLLIELIEQTETDGVAHVPISEEIPAALELRGQYAMARLAPRLGRSAEAVGGLIDGLAALYVDVGIGFAAEKASLALLCETVGSLRVEMLEWSQVGAGDGAFPVPNPRYAMAVASASELTSRMTAVPLQEARLQLTDMPRLLQAMATQPDELAERIARASWLLDGWEQIVQLWHAAPEVLSRADALAEMARQLPALPNEAEAWLGLPPGTADQLLARHSFVVSEPLASGPVRDPQDVVERNEQLRAMAV